MPELPEVETIVRQLRKLIVGQKLCRARAYDPLLGNPPLQRCKNLRLGAVRRMGKHAVLEFGGANETQWWVGFHLRMTGRLIWQPEPPWPRVLPLRARLHFERGALLFVDPRRFGRIEVADCVTRFAPLGLDPTSRAFTALALSNLLKTSKQPIKPWLMRQDRLVGIGNIYASEALFSARINPEAKACSLTNSQVARLRAAIVHVLKQAIKKCGTTFSDFQDAHGVTGSYQTLLAVYGREDEPCPHCQQPIRRIVQAQRSTFFCSRCQ